MKKTNLIKDGLEVSDSFYPLRNFNKWLEKDEVHFLAFKAILDEHDIEIEMPSKLNYNTTGSGSAASWTQTYKRQLIDAYKDSVLEGSGLKISKYLDEVKIFTMCGEFDNLKTLTQSIWLCEAPIFHMNPKLAEEYREDYVKNKVYNEDAKALAHEIWDTVARLKKFDADELTIKTIFSKYGMGMKINGLTSSSLEDAVGLDTDDPTRAVNVRGSQFSKFKPVEKKVKKAKVLPKPMITAEDFIRGGSAHLLIPSVRKATEKKMKSMF